MGVDLFLQFDDDDIAGLKLGAATAGLSLEEHIRKLLAEYVDHPYESLTPADILANDRAHLMFDLRRK